ncbi:MAG: AAA family ATPase [Candidatus Dadabacteria bacterium]|nr:AAA family ATPase [Candidatus Dadabacteria bacterium]
MAEKQTGIFPFTAIVGQDDLKLALSLCAVDVQIGGVLARGEKGTGKTTAVRAMGEMLSEGKNRFPVVNLPIGATEDRVLGAVDLEKLINEKHQSVRAGLLEQANGGILYIDEVNLLDDYLTDILLDAAAAGEYMLERDGISRRVVSRFRLVGTMNVEEGELRPQLLDRFGLCVEVGAPGDTETRTEIARRRMEFDSDPGGFRARFEREQEKTRLAITGAAKNLESVKIPGGLFEKASAMASECGAEGMRADILIVKSARALAALEGRDEATGRDAERVAPFVLAHRSAAARDSGEQTEKKTPKNPKLKAAK